MGPGALIAIEGIDGAGKTTQIRHLRDALVRLGFEVLLEKEPTDGPHGRRLRASAQTGRLPVATELDLFVADRREHVEGVLGPGLARGAVVLLDRYVWSSVAYQGARGLAPDEVLDRNASFPRPDRTVLLDLEPERGVQRVRGRDTVENAFERVEDLRRCRAIFLELHRRAPDRVLLLDATLDEDTLRRVILHDVLCHVLPDRRPALIGALGCDRPATAAWESELWAIVRPEGDP